MKLSDWFNDRTGYRKLVHILLHEPIPGGARWTFIWGSTLVFVFALQLITGILLMTVYSPSATTAWSSVWYIQTQLPLGWLVRGIHHFGSQAMIILLPIHVLQVVLARAYRAPREVNWWLGLGLLGITLGLALTGYLLPWDQKGYWATKVATNIMGLTPVIGEFLQKLVVGGSEYGHLTLSRFFTLHVMVLPGLFILFLLGHIAMFRRHGVTVANKDAEGEGYFWPDQFLKDSIGCLVVLIAIVIAASFMHFGLKYQMLDAPADPAASDYPARPEWYYLFLFQFLKYFEGSEMMEVLGAIVIPGAVGLVLFLIPLLDKIMWRGLAHFLTLVIVFGLLGGAGWLTYKAFQDDHNPTQQLVTAVQEKLKKGESLTPADLAIDKAHQFNQQRAEADRVAKRVLVIAAEQSIPPSGPLELVANDPIIRGPVLFAAPGNCASCHRFNGHNGLGQIPPEPATSSDLGDFATKEWVRSLLENPMDEKRFGLMKKEDGQPAHTKMSKWIEDILAENESPETRQALMADFDAVAAYLEDESIHPGRLADIAASTQPTTQPAAPLQGEALILRGRVVFMNTCNECHSYKGERSGSTKAPEMFGYGSVEWLEKMIADPSHDTLYRSSGAERAQMPAFKNKLSERDRRLIAQWLHDSRSTPP